MENKKFILIAFGTAVGFGGGYFVGSTVSKKKWQKIADKEIESIKKLYSNTRCTNKSSETPNKQNVPDDNADKIKDYSKMYRGGSEADELGITAPTFTDSYSTKTLPDNTPDPPKVENVADFIYYITNEDYATSTYDALTLTFWKDAVITDDSNNELYPDDIEENVLNLVNNAIFADTDVIYIRNDIKEIDFEVIKEERSFKDLQNDFPNED